MGMHVFEITTTEVAGWRTLSERHGAGENAQRKTEPQLNHCLFSS
jgi:hypothetical protein